MRTMRDYHAGVLGMLVIQYLLAMLKWVLLECGQLHDMPVSNARMPQLHRLIYLPIVHIILRY